MTQQRTAPDQGLALYFVEQTGMDQHPEKTRNGGIARVVTIRRVSEPEPLKRYTPQEAIAEVEELRRMFVTKFGDPDAPIAKVVIKRRHEQ